MRKSLELSAQQRAGLLVYWLACGAVLTTEQVAEKLKLSPSGAKSMLGNISHTVPLVCEGGKWRAHRTAQEGR